jgi:hypothetical protein
LAATREGVEPSASRARLEERSSLRYDVTEFELQFGYEDVTVRSSIPSVARSANSEITGNTPAAFHSSLAFDQS